MQKKHYSHKLLIILVIFPLWFGSSAFKSFRHPFFISVTEIRVDEGKPGMSVSCKLFTDDFQQALHVLYKVKLDLSKPDTTQNKWIEKYIREHLKIVSGKQQIQLKLIGYEIEEEACWCYLETNSLIAGQQLVVTNTLLYDFIESQTNLIHYYLNNKRSSFKLVNPENTAIFK